MITLITVVVLILIILTLLTLTYTITRVTTHIGTPNLPTNSIPTHIARLKLSGKFPMDMRIPPL